VNLFSETASATWGIAALATSGVIIRPWRLPEAVWAVLGAATLVALGLLPWTDAVSGVLKGLDVYLFLLGMMLLAELARREGLFDWLAALAVERARGSPQQLFTLIYIVGTLVTVFLSNDATAVVLTPAVYAAARAAQAEPLPYLFICAFIANAASFVLPISNPANLVIFGAQMPSLPAWLAQFALPSLASIGATYVALRLSLRGAIESNLLATKIDRPRLSRGGWMAAAGIGATALALLSCSAFGLQLGLPTFLCGAAAAVAIFIIGRQSPWPVLKDMSWGVLPLVAGLFVLVEALGHTGVIAALNRLLGDAIAETPISATWGTGLVLALASNLMNNLPVGHHRRIGDCDRSCATAHRSSCADWRRSRPQPVCHRIARHHPLARGTPPRGSGCRRVAVSSPRGGGDVSGPDPRHHEPDRAHAAALAVRSGRFHLASDAWCEVVEAKGHV
jgi:arsenical pump membrane protein